MGGGLTTYPVPTPGAGVSGITARPGRRPVVHRRASPTRSAGSARDGEIVEIPLGEGASPTGITTGADGAIWFSAQGTNRVGRLEPSAPPADDTAPTVTIVSPADGSVLTDGEGMLADYFCTDEAGGSGVASCDGPGRGRSDRAERSRRAHVHGHGQGRGGQRRLRDPRATSCSRTSAGRSRAKSVFSAGRVIPIILELGGHPQGSVFASGFPLVRAVDCATGEATGPDQPANVQANLTNNGRLMLQWRTGAGWAGRAARSCSGSGSAAGRTPTPCSRSASPDAALSPARTPSCSSIRALSSSRPNGRECPAQTRSTGSAAEPARATPRTPPRPRRREDRRAPRCRP